MKVKHAFPSRISLSLANDCVELQKVLFTCVFLSLSFSLSVVHSLSSTLYRPHSVVSLLLSSFSLCRLAIAEIRWNWITSTVIASRPNVCSTSRVCFESIGIHGNPFESTGVHCNNRWFVYAVNSVWLPNWQCHPDGGFLLLRGLQCKPILPLLAVPFLVLPTRFLLRFKRLSFSIRILISLAYLCQWASLALSFQKNSSKKFGSLLRSSRHKPCKVETACWLHQLDSSLTLAVFFWVQAF